MRHSAPKQVKEWKMKNQLFALLAAVIALGFTTTAYSETTVFLEPTTDITAAAVGEQVTIDIKITGGKGVAGYGAFVVFDSAALKYIGTMPGDYLPTGGIWMSPELQDDGSYEVILTVGDTTISGKSVQFPPAEVAPEPALQFSIDNVLFEIPELPPDSGLPNAQYSAFSFLASSPLGADTEPGPVDSDGTLGADIKPVPVDGDGTLATLIFEVIEPKPAAITLQEINISDTDDAPLESTLENSLITVNAADAGGRPAVDVNGDGKVNILDLVFVAGKFGQPVNEGNRAADVNADGKINIQDLVLIAQHFGT